MSYIEINLKPGEFPFDLDFIAKAKEPCKELENQQYELKDIELLKVSSASNTAVVFTSNNYDEMPFEFDKVQLTNGQAKGILIMTLSRNNSICCNSSIPEIKIKNPDISQLFSNSALLYLKNNNKAEITLDSSPILFNQNSNTQFTGADILIQREKDLRYSGLSNPEFEKIFIPFTYSVIGNPCINKVSLSIFGSMKDCNGKELANPIENYNTIQFGIKCGNNLDTSKLKVKPLTKLWTLAEIPYNIIYDDTNPDYINGSFLVIEYDFKSIPDSIAVVPESKLTDILKNYDACADNNTPIPNITVDDNFINANALNFIISDAPNIPISGLHYKYNDTYQRTHEGKLLNDPQITRGSTKSIKMSEEINGRGMLYIDYPTIGIDKQPTNQRLFIFTSGWNYYINKIDGLKNNNLSIYNSRIEPSLPNTTPCSNNNCTPPNFCLGDKCIDASLFQGTSYVINISCPIPKIKYPYGPLTIDLVDEEIINTAGIDQTDAIIELKIKGGIPPYTIKMVSCCDKDAYGIGGNEDLSITGFVKINPQNNNAQTFNNNNSNYVGFPTNNYINYNNKINNTYSSCGIGNVIFQANNIGSGNVGEEITYNINLSTLITNPNCSNFKTNLTGVKNITSKLNRGSDNYTNVDLIMENFCRYYDYNNLYNNTAKSPRGLTIFVWDSSETELANNYNIGSVINDIPNNTTSKLWSNNFDYPKPDNNKLFATYPFIFVQNKSVIITINECLYNTSTFLSSAGFDVSINNIALTIKKPNPINNPTSTNSIIDPNLIPSNFCGFNGILNNSSEFTINAVDYTDLILQIENDEPYKSVLKILNKNLITGSFEIAFNDTNPACFCNKYEIILAYNDGSPKIKTGMIERLRFPSPFTCMRDGTYIAFDYQSTKYCECQPPIKFYGTNCIGQLSNSLIRVGGCLCGIGNIDIQIVETTPIGNTSPALTFKPNASINLGSFKLSDLVTNTPNTSFSGRYKIKFKVVGPLNIMSKTSCTTNCGNCPQFNFATDIFEFEINNYSCNNGGGGGQIGG